MGEWEKRVENRFFCALEKIKYMKKFVKNVPGCEVDGGVAFDGAHGKG
jgi:hypothetical protein